MSRTDADTPASKSTMWNLQWLGLGAAYFFYFGLLGSLQPYLATLYLEHGLDPAHVGPSVALLYVLAGVTPLIAAAGAARLRLHARAACLFCALVALTLGVVVVTAGSRLSHLGYVAAIASLTAAYAPLNALLDTSALQVCLQNNWSFGRLRLMGSLGYIVTATLLGRLLPKDGVSSRVHLAATLLIAAIVAITPLLPSVSAAAPANAIDDGPQQRMSPSTMALACFIGACGLHYASFGPFQYGFTLYGRSVGLSPMYIGLGWSLGVTSEVATFSISAALLARFGWQRLLWVSFLLAPMRWLLLSVLPSPSTFFASQLLHGPSFALFYAASMAVLNDVTPRARAQKSQTLFCALVAGLASGPAMLVAGYAYAYMSLGSMFACMLPANLMTLGLYAVSLRYNDKSREPVSADAVA